MSDQARPVLPENVIPFVLAATGHRDLVDKDLPRLHEQVSGLIGRMKDRMASTPLLLLSGLAEGADQLVATAALERGAYLAAVLPLPKDLYRSLMSEPARAEFDRLLSQAALVIELPYDDVAELANSEEARVRQYCALEDFLALHCQALIALWDGTDPRKSGGTFDVVRSVLAGVKYPDCMEPLRGTVYHIVTPRQSQAVSHAEAFQIHVLRCPSDLDEYAPAVPHESLQKKFKVKASKEEDRTKSSITEDDIKAWRLEPHKKLWRKIALKRGNGSGFLHRRRSELWVRIVEPSPTEKHLEEFNRRSTLLRPEDFPKWRLQPANWNKEPWRYLDRIEKCHRRADVLALQSQKQKSSFSQWILLFVLLAAVGLATQSNLLTNYFLPWLFFPVFIVMAFGVHKWAGKRGVENWFLDARVLAEALRVQYFWELGGVRKPVWQYYLAHRPSELGWVISALRSIALLSHEENPAVPATQEDLKSVLEGWVKDQAEWYEKRSQKQRNALKAGNKASNAFLVAVVMVSIIYGALMLSSIPGLASLRNATRGWGSWIDWSIAIVSVGIGIFKVWLDQAGYDEQARNYRRMSHLFAHRQMKLDAILDPKDNADAKSLSERERLSQAIDVLRELGPKALEENSIWLILHREHPLNIQS
jgi:hypothetical protein